MVRAMMLIFSLLLLFPISSVCAQGQKQNKGSSSAFGVDYFADLDPGTKVYVSHVTRAHVDRIMGWVQKGRMNNAVGECKYTLDRVPNHPKGLMLCGMVARLTKSPAFAVSYYEQAIKLYPQYALTHAQYGSYLVEIGDIKAGVAKLEKAIEMDPKLTLAHTWLVKAYQKSGNLELARRAGERAKELDHGSKTSKHGIEE